MFDNSVIHYCKIAKDTCPKGYVICCASCEHNGNCEDACLNSKEKCGLSSVQTVGLDEVR